MHQEGKQLEQDSTSYKGEEPRSEDSEDTQMKN